MTDIRLGWIWTVRLGDLAVALRLRGTLKPKTPSKRPARAAKAEDGTLTDRAYRELEEMIVTLQLSPGTVLSEQVLALRLKIGRTPIREALQRLARDGLVVIMPRRGIMVSEINLRLQLRLLEVRRELERLMAGLAAERATPEERREFAEVAEAMLAAAAKSGDKKPAKKTAAKKPAAKTAKESA